MRMRLSRRSELLVPLALLIPSLAGRPREAAVIAAASALGRLCTLHGAESFRAAAAQEISPARVRGAWTAALLTTLLFAAIALVAGPSVWTWLFAAPPPRETWLALWLTGASLAIACLGDEHLRAAGQGGNGCAQRLCARSAADGERVLQRGMDTRRGRPFSAGRADAGLRRGRPAVRHAELRAFPANTRRLVARVAVCPAGAAVAGGVLAARRGLGRSGIPAGNSATDLRRYALSARWTRVRGAAPAARNPRGRALYRRAFCAGGARHGGPRDLFRRHGLGDLRRVFCARAACGAGADDIQPDGLAVAAAFDHHCRCLRRAGAAGARAGHTYDAA